MQVGLLGLGAMGARVADNLLGAKHQLSIYNRTAERAKPLAERGAVIASSPAQAARGADIVISMVRDDDASRAVWTASGTGALNGLGQSAIAVESSTLRPAWVRELAGLVEARGATFLDAPMVGSRPQAEGKQLVYLVGGEAATLEAATPVLTASAKAIHHVGPVGAAAAFKLVVNALFAIQVATGAELLRALDLQGLDPTRVLELLSTLPVSSPAFQNTASLMLRDEASPQFPIALVEKDLGYALSLAENGARMLPLTAQARSVFHDAVQAGLGELNITGVARLHRPTVMAQARSGE